MRYNLNNSQYRGRTIVTEGGQKRYEVYIRSQKEWIEVTAEVFEHLAKDIDREMKSNWRYHKRSVSVDQSYYRGDGEETSALTTLEGCFPQLSSGSAGPTTSGRMDAYAPTMMSVGARGMIGKGARLPEVVDAMKKYSGVYFGAIGGAGALLAKCIKKAELIAYEDLGAEALRKLYVEDMPVVVIIDSEGNNLYEEGRKAYLDSKK